MVDLRKSDADEPDDSDASSKTIAGANGAKPAPSGSEPAATSEPPRSIITALYGIGVQLLFAAVAAVLAWPLADELRTEIIKANNKATGKDHKVLCSVQQVKGCLNVDSTLHSLQIRTLLGTIFVTAVLIYAATRIYRGVRTGRTIYIAVSIVGGLFIGFGGSPLAIASAFASGPAAPRVVQAIAGFASVAVIVLLFRPDATQFFAARSPRPAAAAGRPAGLGGLFRPGPPRERKPAPTTGVRSTAASRAEARLDKVAKAKSRNDAEAIARGAELARSRAKAAKSRRSER
jgi:hypothetical protein